MEGNAWNSDDEKYSWENRQSVEQKAAAIISLLPEEDTWRQEVTPSQSPELKLDPFQYSQENAIRFVEVEEKEINSIEEIKNELWVKGERDSQEEEQIYSLHATAADDDLIRKVLTLQEKLKGEMIKVFKSQESHKKQVDQNRTLKEYVQNLMKSSSARGIDRFGRPIATGRSFLVGLGLNTP